MSMQEFMYEKNTGKSESIIYFRFVYICCSLRFFHSKSHKTYFRSYEEPFLSVDHVDAN